MINHWLKRANEIVEKEVLLVRMGLDTHRIFNELSNKLPAIFTYNPKAPHQDDYLGKIGICHSLRMHKLGIEGVLVTAKRYHRYPLYLMHSMKINSDSKYWVVVYDGSM